MNIYYCKTDEFNEADTKYLLCNKRKARMKKYLQQKDRLLCLVSGLMLQNIFGEDYEQSILYGKHSKPYFSDNRGFFSLSHSGKLVVLATADCEIGADAQEIGEYNEKIAERCFCENEIAWLKTQSNGFFKIWTAKESIMKATGLGFNLNPDSFDVLPIDETPHQVFAKSYSLYPFAIDGYEICVASETQQQNVRLIEQKRSFLLQKYL